MDRKAISALLAGCEPDQMMAFKDYGDHVAVIDPAGRKYIYTTEQLEAARPAEPKAKPTAPAKRAARPTKAGTGKPAKRRAPAKKSGSK